MPCSWVRRHPPRCHHIPQSKTGVRLGSSFLFLSGLPEKTQLSGRHHPHTATAVPLASTSAVSTPHSTIKRSRTMTPLLQLYRFRPRPLRRTGTTRLVRRFIRTTRLVRRFIRTTGLIGMDENRTLVLKRAVHYPADVSLYTREMRPVFSDSSTILQLSPP